MDTAGDRLLAWSCIASGAVAGGLIALPPALEQSGSTAPLLLVAGTAAGALIGHRRRTSRGFLYFCLLVVLTLLTVLLLHAPASPPTAQVAKECHSCYTIQT